MTQDEIRKRLYEFVDEAYKCRNRAQVEEFNKRCDAFMYENDCEDLATRIFWETGAGEWIVYASETDFDVNPDTRPELFTLEERERWAELKRMTGY